MQWFRRAAGGLITAAAVWLVWYLVAGPGAVTATEPVARAVDALPLASEGNTFVLWGNRNGRGVKDCEVTARQFRLSADGRYRELIGITKAVFYEQGRAVARATAGRARQDQLRNTLEVAGGLTIHLEPGTRVADGTGASVTTSRARWDGGARRLALPEPLLFTHARSRFRARSAAIDFPAGSVRLRQVKGVASGALVSTPLCDYDLETQSLSMKRLDYRSPGVRANVASARLNTRTGDFVGEQVTMKAIVRELAPAGTGGRLLASAALAGLLAAGSGAAPAGPPEKAPAGKKTVREIDFSAGSVKVDKARQITVLENKAPFTPENKPRFTHRDTEFTAERIEVQEEDGEVKVVIATGSPRATDPRSTIAGEKFTISPKQRRIIVEGGFKVVTRPKEEPVADQQAATRRPPPAGERKPLRKQVKGETTITGEKLVYDYRRKDVEANGNLKVLNRGRTITAQSLTYTDRTEDLVLNGEAIRWEDEKGQHVAGRGPFKINLKEGGETLETSGPVTGRFVITEDDDDEETTPAGSSGEKAPPPAPRAQR